jgi:hypothetical protein
MQTVRQVPSIQTLLSVPSYRIADDHRVLRGVFRKSGVLKELVLTSDGAHIRRCSVDV